MARHGEERRAAAEQGEDAETDREVPPARLRHRGAQRTGVMRHDQPPRLARLAPSARRTRRAPRPPGGARASHPGLDVARPGFQLPGGGPKLPGGVSKLPGGVSELPGGVSKLPGGRPGLPGGEPPRPAEGRGPPRRGPPNGGGPARSVVTTSPRSTPAREARSRRPDHVLATRPGHDRHVGVEVGKVMRRERGEHGGPEDARVEDQDQYRVFPRWARRRSSASGLGAGRRGRRPTTSAGTSGTKGETTPGARRVTSRPTSRSWTGCSSGAHSASTSRSPSRRRSCQLPPSSRAIRIESNKPGSAASAFHSSDLARVPVADLRRPTAAPGGRRAPVGPSRGTGRRRTGPRRPPCRPAVDPAPRGPARRSIGTRAPRARRVRRTARRGARGRSAGRSSWAMSTVYGVPRRPQRGTLGQVPTGPTGWEAAGRPTAARGAPDAPP